VRYGLSFAIPESRSGRIIGRAPISFVVGNATAALPLDFEPNGAGPLRRVDIGGVVIEPMLSNGHLVLPSSALRVGRNTVTIEFDTGDAPLNRNDDFLYTIFVPARAHEAFPCFDQPDLKARWTLSLDVPEEWQVLANGAERSHESRSGRTRVAFAESKPIS